MRYHITREINGKTNWVHRNADNVPVFTSQRSYAEVFWSESALESGLRWAVGDTNQQVKAVEVDEILETGFHRFEVWKVAFGSAQNRALNQPTGTPSAISVDEAVSVFIGINPEFKPRQSELVKLLTEQHEDGIMYITKEPWDRIKAGIK